MVTRGITFDEKGIQQQFMARPERPYSATMIARKRRTVLWLFQEDYNYLAAVAEHDSDSKNVSVHRLIKALRNAGIKSFTDLESHLKPNRERSFETRG